MAISTIIEKDHFKATERALENLLAVDEALSPQEQDSLRADTQGAAFAKLLIEFYNASYSMNVDVLEDFDTKANQLRDLAPPIFKVTLEELLRVLKIRVSNGDTRDRDVVQPNCPCLFGYLSYSESNFILGSMKTKS